MITTRRVSEGHKRENVASDESPSLTYVSGCDYIEKRDFKTYVISLEPIRKPKKPRLTPRRLMVFDRLLVAEIKCQRMPAPKL
jgi:hypothetical protein